MFERFTERARNVVVTAQEEGRALGHTQIGGEHILLGILTQPESVGAKVLMLLGVDEAAVRAEVTSLGGSYAAALRAIGIDLEQVRRRAEEAFGPGALDRPVGKRVGRLFRRGYIRQDASGHLPFGNDAKVLLARSLREALELRHN
jgi:Clp amino terminal domain, pathogenicity island component